MKKEIFSYFKRLFEDDITSLVAYPMIFCAISIFVINNKCVLLSIDYKYFIIFGIAIGIGLIARFISLYFKPFINEIDYTLVYITITSIVLTLLYLLKSNILVYAIIVIALLICSIIIRPAVILKRREEILQESIIDLKTICERPIDLSKYDKCVVLEEDEVNYDLLGRDVIIEQMYTYMFSFKTSKEIVIGLNGKWGSGKTTIIKNILDKANKNGDIKKCCLVEFNPCVFDNDKKMIEEFVNKILSVIKIPSSQKLGIVRKIVESYFEHSNSFIKDVIENFTETYNYGTYDGIENVINNTLIKKRKKLLIIIDDLDRMRIERAVLLVSFLNQITKFNNTCIVILYDKTTIEKCLRHEYQYDKSFLDKYINIDLNVPELNENNISIIRKAVSANITYKRKPLFPFLDNHIYFFDSLRDFKKFLNKLLANNMFYKKVINNSQLAALIFIQHECFPLYEEIWTHRNYFLLYDNSRDIGFYMNEDKYKKNVKQYLEKLFQNLEYKKFQPVIEFLFPNIHPYISDVSQIESFDDNVQFSNSIKNSEINNAIFFDLYFTHAKNSYIDLYEEVRLFIERINKKNTSKKEIINYCQMIKANRRKEFYELLHYSIDFINQETAINVIDAFIEQLYSSSLETQMFEISEENRVLYILADLFKSSRYDINSIFQTFYYKDKNFYYIYEIMDYLRHKYSIYDEYTKSFYNKYKEECDKIFDYNLGVMDDEDYRYRNLRGLYHYDKQRMRQYLSETIDENNILNLLRDLIDISVDANKYGYSIHNFTIKNIVPDFNFDKYISKININKLNPMGKFVLSVYNKSKNLVSDDDVAVITDYYVDLRKNFIKSSH